MLILAIISLFVMAFVNYKIGGQVLLHPAVVFCSAWGGGLLVIWLMGNFFYRFSPVTLLIYVGGAAVFSIGSALSYFRPRQMENMDQGFGSLSNKLLNGVIIFEVLCTPLALRWFLNQVSQHQGINYFARAGFTMLDESVRRDPGFVLWGNLVVLANMTLMVSFAERKNRGKRLFLTICFALLLDLLTTSRSAMVMGIFSLLCLDWIQQRRIRWKLLLASGVAFVVLVSTIAVVLGKNGANPDASIAENAVPVLQGIALYGAGSTVAFDRLLQDPGRIPRDLQISIFLVQTLNKLGAHLSLPNVDAGFENVAPGLGTNTYTIYFTYLDLGYPGMMAMMAVLGYLVTGCYRRAMGGDRIAAVMYGYFFSGLILSLFAEAFFDSLNILAKLFVLLWCVYSLPSAIGRFGRFVAHSTQRQVAEFFRT